MTFSKTMFEQTNRERQEGKISISEFRDQVLAKMQQQAPDISVVKNAEDVAMLDVSTSDGTEGQCTLTNFYENFILFDGAQEEAIQQVVDGILVAVRPEPDVTPSNLLPLIRTAAYLGETPDEMRKSISQPFCGELYEVCMVDLPTALRGLQKSDLEQLQIDAPLATARENMRKFLPAMFKTDDLGFADLYSIEDQGHLAPSLILFDEFWERVEKDYPNGCIIALPRRDQLFLIDLSDPNAVENAQHLVRVTFADNFNLLTSELYVRKAGVISILDVS